MSNVHASCVVIGAAGVLIRGGSGTGKTSLAFALVEAAASQGRFAAFVADDRVDLSVRGGRLVARAPAVLAGRAERRGRGVERVDHVSAAVVRLVIDLMPADALDRLPDCDQMCCTLEGIAVPRQPVPQGDAPRAVALIGAALGGSDDLEA